MIVRYRSEAPGRRPGGATEYPVDESRLYVGGMGTTVTDSMLRTLFEPFGQVRQAKDSGFGRF